MKKLQSISNNELNEMLYCVNRCIDTMQKDFLHIAQHLQKEINELENRRLQIIHEHERREA